MKNPISLRLPIIFEKLSMQACDCFGSRRWALQVTEEGPNNRNQKSGGKNRPYTKGNTSTAKIKDQKINLLKIECE